MLKRVRDETVRYSAIGLVLFTLLEVNYPLLTPQAELAIFAALGLMICFLTFPLHPSFKEHPASRALDLALAAVTLLISTYLVVQSEPYFSAYWDQGRSLGGRAGLENSTDVAVGVIGLLLVLEATRRAIGWALPILSLAFLLYAAYGPSMPGWLFPHRGYSLERIVSQAFLQGQGVYGTALKVMFTYVFLFVLFGVLLEMAGATGFIIDLARRIFRKSSGGAAKVAVLSSGLMGSLSGSAVANTATTGTFTIPMMRSSGFQPRIAAGVEAAASSGGALVPPIMGAGAYMMLEIVTPPVTYLEIIRAALLPAMLYYLSLLLIVHFYARRVGSAEGEVEAREDNHPLEGFIFFGSLAALIAFLVVGYTPFRAVTLAMAAVLVLAVFHSKTRIGFKGLLEACQKTATSGVALVAAASCVGIIIGVVTLTGVGTRFPSLVLPLAEQNLFLALVLIMVSSIVLGMGLPSAVCYLLLATLIGPMLGNLGVVPLAAHFFIFYFGMMAMVTPPVALAAYTAASIAQSPIMKTSVAAFRIALVGFSLPYIFVARPQLLMLSPDGSAAPWSAVIPAFVAALLGIVPLAAGIAGYFFARLSGLQRALMILAAVLTLFPGGRAFLSPSDLAGLALFLTVSAWNFFARQSASPAQQS
ncbi:MAG TPA: TRAP transporter fused permease subunit [Acidobacteriota bacterium]|nr:TRAP transporter fused permease subunit [Acidobacteriota bacterium]